MFLAISGDPERDDEAMLADVHAVNQQADQVEALERVIDTADLSSRPADRIERNGAGEVVLRTNVVAPLALVAELAPHLSAGVTIIDISSDAAVEAYERRIGWKPR